MAVRHTVASGCPGASGSRSRVPGCVGWRLRPVWPCHGDYRASADAAGAARGRELVRIRTQQWALERWDGEDEPGLAVPWARKPKFAVSGSRSCAELAIVHHLQAGGWGGVWVNAFRGELRTQWFPAPAARQLAEVGAPR